MKKMSFKSVKKLVISVFLPIVAGLLVLVLAFLFGNEIGVFTGFPKGYDAYGHMSLTRIFRDSFPHLYWNPYWDSGTTLLVRSYPPLAYLLGAILSQVLGWSVELVFIGMSLVSVTLIALGIYWLTFKLTNKPIAGLISSLLLLSSSAFWAYLAEGGLYPRLFGAVPLVWSMFWVWSYLRKEKNNWGGRYYWLSVLTLFFAFGFHQLSAAWSTLIVTLLVFIGSKDRRLIFKKIICLFLPVGGLAAFYYLPLLRILGQNPPSWGKFLGQPAYTPVSFTHLFRPETTLIAIPILLIPLAIVGVWLRFGQKIENNEEKRVLMLSRVMFLGALLSLAYAMGVFQGYIHGVYPHHFLFYFTIFLSVFTGLNIGLIKMRSSFDQLLMVGICTVLVVSWLKQVPLLKEELVDYSVLHSKTFAKINLDLEESNFRFGNADEVVAGWLNLNYLIPQTRDYYPFGPINPDWQYYMEEVVFRSDESEESADFFLDWYAVRDLFHRPPSTIQSKGSGRFDRSGYMTEDGLIYRSQKATPILSATNALVAAVVADQESYDTLVKNLALGNLNSQTVVTYLVGGKLVDLRSANLEQVDLIFLSGFKGSVSSSVAAKLSEFVKNGGRLLIEKSAVNYDFRHLSDPWPISRVVGGFIGEDERLKAGENPIIKGIDFKELSGLTQENWQIETGSSLKTWASPVVYYQDQPVVVAGQLGEGLVVWSGLGMFEYLWGSQESQELSFLTSIFSNFKAVGEPVDYQARFINNHRREIEVRTPVKGIVFKESFVSNWQAFLGSGNKTLNKLKAYPAGPGMMFVPLPIIDSPMTISLTYKLSLLEILGLLISLLTLMFIFGCWLRSLGQRSFKWVKAALRKSKK
ncbi:hypothetical protein ACFL0Y_02755 [Patescibacteria group bacterium]